MAQCKSKLFYKIEQKVDHKNKITKEQSKKMLDDFIAKYPEILETCKRMEEKYCNEKP